MEAIEVSREQFFDMAGVQTTDGAFTPPSIGKGMAIRDGNRAWIRSMRKLDFTDSDGLMKLRPEHVSDGAVVIPIEKVDDQGSYYIDETPQEDYKAIVGDVSKRVYSIRSDKYHAVQHSDIVEALVDASESTGIQVFGRIADRDGRMNIHAFFADPDCNIDLKGNHKDPCMLGVRCWNSHTGTTGFGMSVQGVRWLCSNMMAFGDSLGSVSWNHMAKRENIAQEFASTITGFMDRVPALQDRLHVMGEEVLTLDEAECALWGITVSPFRVDAVMQNIEELEPTAVVSNGKVSLLGVYHALNAYTTYANSGGSDWSKTQELARGEDLVVKSLPRLIDAGFEKREAYRERMKTLDLRNAVLVSD